jgi:phage terminase small subunit
VRLEGNRGKRKLPSERQEVKIADGVPDCPDWLLPEAKREWKRLAPQLSASRLLTHVDRGQLAAICQTWARYVNAEKGDLALALDYAKELRMQYREFGMTPSARARMVLPGEAPKDDMEDLLSGAK